MSRDPMQSRLSGLAADVDDGLDHGARARVVDHVQRSGPTIVRRARFRRTAVRVAGGAAAVGLIAFLAIDRGGAPVDDVLACRAWAPATPDGLGPRGTVTFDPDTDAKIVGEDACRTIVDLREGRVTVHADDLGGGTLAVRTSRGEVTVHGTIFSVAARDQVVTIEVEEGRVAWTAKGEPAVYLGASDRLVVGAPAAATTALAPTPDEPPEPERPAVTPKKRKSRPRKQARLRAEPPKPKRPSSSDLVRRAEALRRASDAPGARAAYRAAGQIGDSTGEAAWIALARFELELSQPKAALQALAERRRRFGAGALELEAEWIAVRALSASGQTGRAAQRAKQIVRRWPKSAQAQAASAWLEKQK